MAACFSSMSFWSVTGHMQILLDKFHSVGLLVQPWMRSWCYFFLSLLFVSVLDSVQTLVIEIWCGKSGLVKYEEFQVIITGSTKAKSFVGLCSPFYFGARLWSVAGCEDFCPMTRWQMIPRCSIFYQLQGIAFAVGVMWSRKSKHGVYYQFWMGICRWLAHNVWGSLSMSTLQVNSELFACWLTFCF